ncbi:sulfite exporter TauE/SafE family protein [Lacticaseibacillus daqingensis]|uniref:sulfite exporter TauE/SafE family protein n=1 Tax=Lacticaseibacillus daqingensis TaxID=2486014 RepID=UPI000F7AA99E|nr:sulfite exporter TauE/SafE family protein [Lacticaseibacillus daqingensis]
MIGILYFAVIVVANSLGAVSGMGGGVLIKPVFDAIGVDTVAAISFYSAVAVFTMSLVSTIKQVQHGVALNFRKVAVIALGALLGGYGGKEALTALLAATSDHTALAVQIAVTILTLIFALAYTRLQWSSWGLRHAGYFLLCGLLLGFFASFLGIGGGPINVSLLMLMFGMPIKDATVYSICTIFFSQLSKLASLVLGGDLIGIDLSRLWFIIPAAIIGGYVGSLLSHLLSGEKVTLVFQLMLLTVIVINAYNGVMLLLG